MPGTIAEYCARAGPAMNIYEGRERIVGVEKFLQARYTGHSIIEDRRGGRCLIAVEACIKALVLEINKSLGMYG